MTAKRLRLIALCIRRGIQAHTASTEAIAQELEQHATELEDLERGTRREVKLREPGKVFTDLLNGRPGDTTELHKHVQGESPIETARKAFPKASEGMR